MMTGAFGQNVGKLFSKLKLVTDTLLFICAHAFLIFSMAQLGEQQKQHFRSLFLRESGIASTGV